MIRDAQLRPDQGEGAVAEEDSGEGDSRAKEDLWDEDQGDPHRKPEAKGSDREYEARALRGDRARRGPT